MARASSVSVKAWLGMGWGVKTTLLAQEEDVRDSKQRMVVMASVGCFRVGMAIVIVRIEVDSSDSRFTVLSTLCSQIVLCMKQKQCANF